MWRKPSKRGVEPDGTRRDVERRKFLDRLIEADVIETIEAADPGTREPHEPLDDTQCDDKQRTNVTVDDIADEWRAFDRNRTTLTLTKRLADDYTRRSRQFAIIAGAGAVILIGATTAFVWSTWDRGDRQRATMPDTSAIRPATNMPPAPASAPARGESEIVPVSVRLVVDRTTAADIAFPFELKADDLLAGTSFLIIRGVPTGAIVSYAQPLSPSVWVMPASALTSARLSISTLAPRDFTLAVDALSADGIRYAAFELEIVAGR